MAAERVTHSWGGRAGGHPRGCRGLEGGAMLRVGRTFVWSFLGGGATVWRGRGRAMGDGV